MNAGNHATQQQNTAWVKPTKIEFLTNKTTVAICHAMIFIEIRHSHLIYNSALNIKYQNHSLTLNIYGGIQTSVVTYK